MKQGSTLFLQGAIVFLGLATVALCVFALPSLWKGASEEFPTASLAVHLIVAGLYMTAIPFFIALGQAIKLLRYIKEDNAFSGQSVKALQVIKRCWIVIAILYMAGVPLLFPIAQADDAPGLMLMGLVVALAPITVAVFAAVLQRLLKSGMDLKSENELTV
jgi:hypothetical protein